MSVSLQHTRTKSEAAMPRMKRMAAFGRASRDPIAAKINSSSKNGAANATENGQPSMPPTANQNIP